MRDGVHVQSMGRVAAAAVVLALVAGCVTDKSGPGESGFNSSTRSPGQVSQPVGLPDVNPRGSGIQRPEDVDLSSAFAGLPKSIERSSGGVVAEIAAFSGDLAFDLQTMPLVDPAGRYIVAQQGVSPSWDTVLAREGAAPAEASLSLAVYEIVQDEAIRAFRLHQTKWMERLGILGRGADAEGFLIEAPKEDGSRWIGKVNWSTGEVNWLVKGDRVNAHAVIEQRIAGEPGRMAWCSRPPDSPWFDLVVEGDNEVFTLPGQDGSWLYPVWCKDGTRLFVFFLSSDGRLDLVALDARSQSVLRRPLARQTLVLNGASEATAYQMLAGIQEPSAPDGSLRMIFFHSGLGRVCVFDPLGRSTRGDGGIVTSVLSLAKGSIGGGWFDDEALVLNGSSEVVFQVLPRNGLPQDPTTLLELKDRRRAAMKDPNKLTDALSIFARSVARPTADRRMPFILLAPSPNQSSYLRVGALVLLDARVLKPVKASR